MYTEDIHIGVTAKTSKVIGTIEFEEEDLIREGLGAKYFNGNLDLHRRNYYIGEWLVDLWGRDEEGTLISECSFGGFAEAEWEGETTLDILRFWKLTKVEEKVRRGRLYYVIYSGKRHWDIDEDLYQREVDFLPVLFSLATEEETDVEFEVDGIHYIANDFHTVAVVKPRKEELYYKGSLEIPPTVTFGEKKYTVTEIGDMQDCTELTEVKLPDTVTHIADSAFFRCQKLRAINFPESMEHIGESAFWGCISLEKISLPKTCYIRDYSFAWCEGLKEIGFNEQWCYPKECFMHCKSLKSVVLPKTTGRLDPGVFKGCTNLESVVLNEGLESFYGNDFDDCAIQELKIPKSVVAVYGKPHCENFKGFYVDPENEKFCSIDGVLYSKDMKSLQMCPMSYEGEFKVPDGVEYTSSRAFFSCSLITKIVIPDSVWDIGYESFSQCKNLQTIVIGNGVEEIDEGAFEDCEKLDTVVFGTGLKRIKKHAFHNCKALTKVNLPDGISNYSVTLFEGCSNLSELTMPEWMEKHRSDIMEYAHGKK